MSQQTGEPRVELVDAFAEVPGQGNRAAIVIARDDEPDEWMALTARTLGFPVTVYVRVRSGRRYSARWFAPSGELRSCGHGTLAAAHVVLPAGEESDCVFSTCLGELPVRRHGEMIEIVMPAEPLTAWHPGESVAHWLGTDVVDAVRSPRHGLLRVADHRTVRGLRPDLSRLASLPVTGLAVTAQGDGEFDIVSRWFVPRHGLEDQATGTAHCLLGPYWSMRLGISRLRAYQASANGARISVRCAGDAVGLAGHAVSVLRGTLAQPLMRAASWDGG